MRCFTRAIADGSVKGSADDADVESSLGLREASEMFEMAKTGNSGERPLQSHTYGLSV
jgi:hypothetical protein